MEFKATREQIEEGVLRAKKEREDKIAQAIERGVPICRLSAPLFAEERETNINIVGNEAVIDTTVDKFMTKCFKNNYEIIGLTMYEDKVVGLTCKFNVKQISLRR